MLAKKPLSASMLQTQVRSKTHCFLMSNLNLIWPHGGRTKAPTQREMARVVMEQELATGPGAMELGPGTEPAVMELGPGTGPVAMELEPGTEPAVMGLDLATEPVETEPAAMEAATSPSSQTS
jgi:hypothetical protein